MSKSTASKISRSLFISSSFPALSLQDEAFAREHGGAHAPKHSRANTAALTRTLERAEKRALDQKRCV
jgi:hypothetical protein